MSYLPVIGERVSCVVHHEALNLKMGDEKSASKKLQQGRESVHKPTPVLLIHLLTHLDI